MKWGFVTAFVLAAGVATGRAEITLTDIRGQKATVEVTEATPSQISFVMQGRKGAIKLSELSEDSQAAVVAYAKSKNIYRAFPPLIVQVKVALQRRNSEQSYYETNAKLTSAVVVEGKAKLAAVPAAEATIVLITQDTREKYVKHVEKLKVWATDTVSIPAAGSGERREFPFATAELVYDLARDPTNVGGNEYKYYIFGLRDPESKQLVDFQSNCPPVMHYAELHPEARDTLLSLRKGEPFSSAFPER
jgi:hypothetical protein